MPHDAKSSEEMILPLDAHATICDKKGERMAKEDGMHEGMFEISLAPYSRLLD